MKITLDILGDELKPFYPSLTVYGGSHADILRTEISEVSPNGGQFAANCIYCMAAEDFAHSGAANICFLLPTPPESGIPENAIILGEDCDLHRVNSRIQEILLKIMGWQAKMMEISTTSSDFQALMDVGEQMFTDHILLLSLLHDRFFVSTMPDIDAILWEKLFQAFNKNEIDINSVSMDMIAHYHTCRTPFLYPQPGRVNDLLAQNIFRDGSRVATITVPRKRSEPRKCYYAYIQELTRCIEIMFSRTPEVPEEPMPLVIRRMLQGQQIPSQELETVCRDMGWVSQSQTFRVVVIRPAVDQQQFFHSNLLVLRSFISRIYKHSIVLIFGSSIVIVRNYTSYALSGEAPDPMDALSETMRNIHAVMGVSMPFSDLCHIPVFYEQASAASKVCGADSPDYASYLMYDIISSFGRNHVLRHYIHPDILRLAQQEEAGHAPLLSSLYQYLLNDRSYKISATKLNVHRNTFAYHITKALNLLTCDLEDENTRLSLLLSICMYWYLNPEKDPIGISVWNPTTY